jgi:hypothetical protein
VIQQWALEEKKIASDTYSLTQSDLLAHMKSSRMPECPGGGTYSAGSTVTGLPTCSLSGDGHTL